jgi:hypothetical protein
MKQAPVLSSSGMFSRFNVTRVVRAVELDYNQILRAFDTLKDGQVHRNLSLVLVDKVEQKIGNRFKQINILKAVLVSDKLYSDAKIANPAVVPFITEINTSDDFFLPDDRLTRALPRLAPKQERKESTHIIGGGGLVTIGIPYVDATLYVTPALVPTATNGTAGTVTFPVINVGDTVRLSYVTQALHPTLIVGRQEPQTITPSLDITNSQLAILMNSTLAGLLGIALPAY